MATEESFRYRHAAPPTHGGHDDDEQEEDGDDDDGDGEQEEDDHDHDDDEQEEDWGRMSLRLDGDCNRQKLS